MVVGDLLAILRIWGGWIGRQMWQMLCFPAIIVRWRILRDVRLICFEPSYTQHCHRRPWNYCGISMFVCVCEFVYDYLCGSEQHSIGDTNQFGREETYPSFAPLSFLFMTWVGTLSWSFYFCLFCSFLMSTSVITAPLLSSFLCSCTYTVGHVVCMGWVPPARLLLALPTLFWSIHMDILLGTYMFVYQTLIDFVLVSPWK